MGPQDPSLKNVADRLITSLGVSAGQTELVYAGFMLVAALIVFVFALHFAGLFIFFERRIAARMQSRVGPNRVGPNGAIQWAADGIKCLFKEDLIPDEADRPLFRLAPYFVVLGMLLSFAALPFSSVLIATDIDIGILFILGVTALVVIGLLMGGWGSNNKWALLGGMRSAAQVISYEIPAGIAAMSVVVMAGSLSMQDIIKAQGGSPWDWAVFSSPFVFCAFIIFFIAQLAEGNRTPFDLPEAESELVSGYNTEYSGMRFLMFFLGEFANVWVLCAVSVTLFLGGWQIPGARLDASGRYPDWIMSDAASAGIFALLLVGGAIPFVLIVRAMVKYRTRARTRIDQTRLPALGAPLGFALGALPGFAVGLIVGLFAGMGVVPAVGIGVVGALLVGAGVAAFGRGPKSLGLAVKGTLDGFTAFSAALVLGLIVFAVFQLTPAFGMQFSALAGLSWREVRLPIAINGLQLGIFMFKTLALVFLVIQLRWTLPRIRVDQMMTLCWKYLVPLSFVCLVGTMLWEIIVHAAPFVSWLRFGMAALGAVVLYRYIVKTRQTYLADKENFETWRGESAWYPPWRLV